jgi:hypothetical protein
METACSGPCSGYTIGTPACPWLFLWHTCIDTSTNFTAAVPTGDFYQLAPVDKSARNLLPINQARSQAAMVNQAVQIVSGSKGQMRVNNRGFAFLAPAWQQLKPTTIMLDQVCSFDLTPTCVLLSPLSSSRAHQEHISPGCEGMLLHTVMQNVAKYYAEACL